MMRALFAAISGLRNHQLFMDVVGNNLANVNTTGFKSGRMTFSDLLSQTVSSGSAPTATLGGTNSKQIGLGSQISSIDIVQSQGSLQTTGKTTDLALQGEGFFILSNGLRNVFTRDGAFDIASDGALVNSSNGMKVQGWAANATTGAIDTTAGLTSINIPIGQSTTAKETDNIVLAGNLDSTAATYSLGPPEVGGKAAVGLTVVDSLGKAHTVTLTFTKLAGAGQWAYAATEADAAITSATLAGTITFSAAGAFVSATDGTLEVDHASPPGATDQTAANQINIDFTRMTGLATTSEATMTSQDGSVAGTLIAFKLGNSGEVVGVYSNGQSKNLGQLAVASFLNPGGLTRAGGNLFEESASSGAAAVGTPGTSGRGTASAGNLESSNVDLSKEFTNMIIGQRGFQANARVVSTSDEMLQELVNLRR